MKGHAVKREGARRGQRAGENQCARWNTQAWWPASQRAREVPAGAQGSRPRARERARVWAARPRARGERQAATASAVQGTRQRYSGVAKPAARDCGRAGGEQRALCQCARATIGAPSGARGNRSRNWSLAGIDPCARQQARAGARERPQRPQGEGKRALAGGRDRGGARQRARGRAGTQRRWSGVMQAGRAPARPGRARTTVGAPGARERCALAAPA